jgi:leucyl-tRNA synthetase
VERREIPQWFVRITAYADELLDELDRLEGWPEQVVTMQRNWIGRSYGVQMEFLLEGHAETLTVFTTRPDTLMGVTYVAVAAEHPLALEAARHDPELAAFIEECRHGGTSEADLETIEKRGMPLGVSAIHPVSGERVPVYAANFVLMSYGTGAVMAVPAHDERDHAFARRYGIPIRQVVRPADGSELDIQAAAYVDKGVLVDSGPFNGLTSEQAFDAIAEWLAERGRGKKTVHYRLRDWGVSRQRYWGAPIPMVHCERCGVVPVPDRELPVVLPQDVAYDEHTINPLKEDPAFARTTCPSCHGAARRETDTFDTFMESSWYYARFACPDADRDMLDGRADYWLPVDHYVGGIEHAVLHLLYARFYHKLMRDAGLVHSDEPFRRLLTQGMVVADTYYREDAAGHRHWYNPAEVNVERDAKGRPVRAVLEADGAPVEIGGIEKMSKSKNNGVDPQALIERYGADTVRLYTMFTAPPDQSLEWSDEGVEGAHRFLRRLWNLASANAGALGEGPGDLSDLPEEAAGVRREVHEALKKARYDYERQQFNTVVSACMTMVNALNRLAGGPGDDAVLHEGLGIVLRLLAPIAPHLTHHLWRELGYGEEILHAPWPAPDEAALVQERIQYVVQVNGKVRARIQVPAEADQAAIEAEARADDNVRRFVGDAPVRKVIVVPNKLVNIVAK